MIGSQRMNKEQEAMNTAAQRAIADAKTNGINVAATLKQGSAREETSAANASLQCHWVRLDDRLVARWTAL
jgi:hypothetical protein